jgi:hypothetical protein
MVTPDVVGSLDGALLSTAVTLAAARSLTLLESCPATTPVALRTIVRHAYDVADIPL